MVDSLPRAKKAYIDKQNKIEIYKLIQYQHKEFNWSIDLMCEITNVSRSAYYKWLKSKPSSKQLEDNRIVEKIKEISSSNNSLFGTMNMYYTLRNLGFKCGHNRVYRLMCINDIQSVYRRKPHSTYVKSTPEYTEENVLNRDFNTTGPNEKWCTDVTEIKVPVTGEKLYISPMLDLYDRFPVALEVSERNDSYLANTTLENAHSKYPEGHPLVHSDRGSSYTRAVYRKKIEEYGMSQSMSRVSRCIDNGPCEGFQGQFKDILFILYPNIRTKEEMIEAIYGTLDYYINKYPQKRLKGKTCGQVRSESIQSKQENKEYEQYPIKKANRYIKFWQEIEEKKQRALQQCI